MNTELSGASICYGLYDENEIIGFIAVLHQPHGVVKNLKRCSRIVILPDYQGIGLGTKLLNIVAEHYNQRGYKFSIVTSAKNMIGALNRSPLWAITRYSVSKPSTNKNAVDFNRKSLRRNCKTASFIYKGESK